MSSTPAPRSPSVMGSSAVMAVGTVFSRGTGFVRSTLLAAALGTSLHADLFNIANTIPNMLYILLAGGIFNAVLVPQLVRAMKNDTDGGHAYANRVITAAAVFLITVTIVLVIAAPWVMRVLLDPTYFTDPAFAAHRDSAITLARYCLPQVFFYGMFVLLGQVLNARGSFGPMMWAPITNNIISIAILIGYLLTFGAAVDPCVDSIAGMPAHQTTIGPFNTSQELVLGVGSTFGIIAQFLVLLPVLRRTGFTFQARFDLRGTGLGHTLRLGVWTVGFVIVNQIAYTVVVRIASAGTTSLGACGSIDRGTGYTVYANSFLLVMVPHAVITVSLATAMLPRLSRYAADQDLAGLAQAVSSTVRSSYALILPIVALLPILAVELASLVWGYGAAKSSFTDFVPSLTLFAVGLVFFTAHYVLLRGYYALEQTRQVFVIQCFVAATNIAMAILLTRDARPDETALLLVVAYAIAYAVGAVISWAYLSYQLGGLQEWAMLRFLVRMGVAILVTSAVAIGLHHLMYELIASTGKGAVLIHLLVVGSGGMGTYVVMGRLLRITEVTDVISTLTSRLARNR